MNYRYYLNELFSDYASYLESLEHSEDGEYLAYDWCNAPYAKKLIGEDVYEFVIKAFPHKDKNPELYKKMKKEFIISLKLRELEQDFEKDEP